MFNVDEDRISQNGWSALPFWFRAGLVLRSPTIIGIGMIGIGFFFLPWVRFAPTEYLNNTWLQFLIEFAPALFAQWLEWTGQSGATGLLYRLLDMGGISAWALVILIPTSSLWVRGAVLAVALSGVVAIVALSLSFVRKTCCIRPIISWLQCGLALITAIWLLIQMPTIDALGHDADISIRFIATLSGARLGEGAWFSWFGVILLVIGGPMMLVEPSATPSDLESLEM